MVKLNNTDITQYVDANSIVTNDTLDESLASGAFVIPFVTSTQITNGDQPIPRFSEVNIDGLLFVVSEDTVTLARKGTNKLYRHEITLVEPTKILQKRVIPDLTITQPQGDISDYVFTVNKIDETTFTEGGFEVDNSTSILTLLETSESKDTSVLDGRTLKNTQQYEINLKYYIENRQEDNGGFLGATANDPDAEIVIEVYYGTTKIDEKTIQISGRPFNLFSLTNPVPHIGGFKIDYTPSSTGATVSIAVRTTGTNNASPETEDKLYIKELSLTIYQAETEDDKYYLDDVVNKLLQFHPEFTLSDEAEQRLANILSPEFTFQKYTLYDALREVANYATSIVYLGETDFTTIHFYFYDEDIQQSIEYADETQTEYLDGFADGLEINAANVIRDDNQLYAIWEPDLFGWLSVRSSTEERGEQIIDADAAILLQHPIYRPVQVRVKGLEFVMQDEDDNDVTFSATTIWDITDYIVERQVYNTFADQANLNNRGTEKNKANTLYYSQGDNKIYGLGFVGKLPPAWLQQAPPNYAIWEAILNKAAEENPGYTFENNYLINLANASIHDLQFKVRHIPYSDVRLTLYKDNQTGKNIKYFNEQAALNDMELLGRIAQENANRTGNRTIRLQGITGNDRLLLGSKIDDKVLVNYTISRTPTINKFTAEYAIGYSNISDYVGIDSRYRQYEVPVDTIVNRRDKKTVVLQISATSIAPSVTTPDGINGSGNHFYNSLFGNFETNPSGTRATYAKLTVDGSKVVESTIDAYRMGRTLGLAFDMYDNFSAGITKKEREIWDGNNNVTIKTQEDARYTDLLGRFETIDIEYWNSSGASTLTASDNYPDNTTTGVYKFFDYTYTANKDARERFGFVLEIVIQSYQNLTRVYDGFIKYNRLAAELTPTPVEIRFLEAGYFPDRNLDINKTTLGTGTADVGSGNKYLTITATAPQGEYEGLILTLNEEPILAIRSGDYDFGTQVTKNVFTIPA